MRLSMDRTLSGWLYTLLMYLFVHDVRAASTGAKLSACASMTPNHPASPGSYPAPYDVSISSTTYSCDESILVTVKSTGTPAFRGFLCQARKVWNVYQTYGVLAMFGNTATTNNCQNNASLTHSDPREKTLVTFVWTAPSHNVGSVHIVCTIVKDFTTHWLNITSPEIMFSGTCPSTTEAHSSTTSTSSSTSGWTSGTPSRSSTLSSSISTVSHTRIDYTPFETNTTTNMTFNVTSSSLSTTTGAIDKNTTPSLTTNVTSSSKTLTTSTETVSSMKTSITTLDVLSTTAFDMTSGTGASTVLCYRTLFMCVSVAIACIRMHLVGQYNGVSSM